MISKAVCHTSSPGCSIVSVALQIQTVGGFPNQDSRVLNGTAQLFDVRITPLSGSDHIYSTATSTGVFNITLPDHMFDYGEVIRDAIVMEDGSIHVQFHHVVPV